MCAGMNGYCAIQRAYMSSGDIGCRIVAAWGPGGWKLDGRDDTHHEGLEVRAPPLSEAITNLPLVVHTVRRVELPGIGRRRKAFVQTPLQSVDFVLSGLQIVARPAYAPTESSQTRGTMLPVYMGTNGQRLENVQLEERVGDLKHEYMRVSVVVHDEDALHSPAHPEVFIVVLQTLQTCRHRRILLWLSLLRAM